METIIIEEKLVLAAPDFTNCKVLFFTNCKVCTVPQFEQETARRQVSAASEIVHN